jgi:hypothetical protein
MKTIRILFCIMTAFGLFFLMSIRSPNIASERENIRHPLKVARVSRIISSEENNKKAVFRAKAKNSFPVFPIVLDCNQTVEEMVKAGKYDWVELEINSDYRPVKCHGISKVDVVLVPIHLQSMASEDLLRELDKHDLRPAEFPELLAFGATYPEKQRDFAPIVALGSASQYWDSRRGAAYLGGGSGGRGLGGPGCWGPGCHSDFQLAAVVRK